HVELADEAYCIGGPLGKDSYLNITNIMTVATSTGVDAVHPGYGFLSESADVAEICRECNITFIGPSPEAISKMGIKEVAKTTMEEAGVPIVPGYDGVVTNEDDLKQIADNIGIHFIINDIA